MDADTQPAMLQTATAFGRRRWREIAGCTLATIIAAVVAVQTVPPRYTARADVLLDPRRDKAFGPDDVGAAVNLDTANVESAQALIKGNAVLQRVVMAERLVDDQDFNGQRGSQASVWHSFAKLLGHRDPRPSSPEQQAVGALYKALKVDRVGKAFVLSISVTTRLPEQASRLANAVADGFVADQRQARLEASRREAAFFADRLAPLGEQLRRSEDALDRFRRDHDLAATTRDDKRSDGPASLNEQQLSELNSRLAAAKAETAQAYAHYDEARAAIAGGRGMESIPDVVRSTLIAQLRQQQAEVARKEGDLAARYSDAYPALINVRAERREIERAITREMARIVANLKGAYQIARSQEDGLRASVTVTTGAAGLDSDVGRQLRELERVKLVDETVFETYLSRAKAAEQRSNFEEHEVRVISRASEPVVPAFPQTKIALFCAALLGLGLGGAMGYARDALDLGFSDDEAVEAALGVPVLGAIPRLRPADRTIDGRLVDPSRLLAQRPHGAYAGAVRALRAGLGLTMQAPPSVTVVASGNAGEGRSTLALSLAVSAALAGRRVLLLDADLRQPSLSRTFGFENRLGLVDMLSGIVGTEETTIPLGPGLAFMPTGRASAVAADLFGSPRMTIYLEHLRTVYDLVVIDVAPAGMAADAAVLATVADRLIFVVGRRSNARTAVLRDLRRLPAGKLAGVVLNEVERRRAPLVNIRRGTSRRLAEA